MRLIPLREKNQRGCQYCADMQLERDGKAWRTACIMDECPYKVLDKYKSYEEFMASEDSKIFVNEYFSTVPTVYEMSGFSHAPKGIFEDKGDFKVHL
jgi:hypothetical protein